MNEQKILLLFPDAHCGYGKTKFPPIAFAYLHAVVKKEGMKCVAIDLRGIGNDPNYIQELIEEHKPQFIGYHATVLNFLNVHELHEQIKKKNPTLTYIVGGPHASFMPQLFENKYDYIVRGEAEKILPKIMKGELQKGIIQYDRIDNIDEIPHPDWSVFQQKKYSTLALVTTRGCPYSCVFCFTEDAIVLTADGSKYISEVNEGDLVRSDNQYVKVLKKHKRKYYGNLVRIHLKKHPHPITCTPTHKIFSLTAGKYIRAKDLKKTDILKTNTHIPVYIPSRSIDTANIFKKYVYNYKRTTKIDKNKIVNQHRKTNQSTRTIAKKLGISKSLVARVIKEHRDCGSLTHNVFTNNICFYNNGSVEMIHFKLGKNPIPRMLKVNELFAELVGFYLSEGCVHKTQHRRSSFVLSFTFNKKEEKYINRVRELIWQIFGVACGVYQTGTATQVVCSNQLIALVMLDLCGKGAENKKVPEVILRSPKTIIASCLKSYIQGDGGLVKKKGYGGKITSFYKAKTVSNMLAQGIWQISELLGMTPSFQKIKPYVNTIKNRLVVGRYTQHMISFQDAASRRIMNLIMYGEDISEVVLENLKEGVEIERVEAIDSIDCEVYNLSVEPNIFNDHSYYVNGVRVHNCGVPDMWGRKQRKRNPLDVIEELKYNKENYGMKHFEIVDDNFTLFPEFVKDLCRKMIEANLELSWDCVQGVRIDRCDVETFELMHKAGCRMIGVGVESGVQNVVNEMKKGLNLEMCAQRVKEAVTAGLLVKGFFLVGGPGENPEDVKESIAFFKNTGMQIPRFGMLVPYEPSELYNWVKDHGTFLIDTTKSMAHGLEYGKEVIVAFETPEFNSEERKKWFTIATREAECWTIKKAIERIFHSKLLGNIAWLVSYPYFVRALAKKIYFNSTWMKKNTWNVD